MSETKIRTEEMGKWLKILFWLLIISTVAGIFITEETVEKVPALQLVSTLFVIAYGGVLLKMSACDPACGRYRTAGICKILSAALSAALSLLSGGTGVTAFALILLALLAAAALDIAGEYQELKGHAAVLQERDLLLSEKWLRLVKWYVGLLAGSAAGVILSALLPLAGVVLVLAAGVGIIVVSVVKIVYLYRTGKDYCVSR